MLPILRLVTTNPIQGSIRSRFSHILVKDNLFVNKNRGILAARSPAQGHCRIRTKLPLQHEIVIKDSRQHPTS